MEAAAATVRRRLELLTPRAHEVEMAWEYSDALHMAPLVYLAAGDLATARHYAQQRRELPFFREADHLAVTWLLTTAALAGDFDEAVELASQFRRGWIEAGRPAASGFAFAPPRRPWSTASAVTTRRAANGSASSPRCGERLTRSAGHKTAYIQVFDGLVALHRGELGDALTRLAEPPESFRHWHDGAWRQWYAAVWAEAAVLAELADRRDRLDRARFIVGHNPVASAIVDRAEAIDAGDPRQAPGRRRRPRRRRVPLPARPHARLRRRRRTGRGRVDPGGDRGRAHAGRWLRSSPRHAAVRAGSELREADDVEGFLSLRQSPNASDRVRPPPGQPRS